MKEFNEFLSSSARREIRPRLGPFVAIRALGREKETGEQADKDRLQERGSTHQGEDEHDQGICSTAHDKYRVGTYPPPPDDTVTDDDDRSVQSQKDKSRCVRHSVTLIKSAHVERSCVVVVYSDYPERN